MDNENKRHVKSVLIPTELHVKLSKHKQDLLEQGKVVTLWQLIEQGLDCLKTKNP